LGLEKLAELEFKLVGEVILTAYWMQEAIISEWVRKYMD
jgi:hypothetical protein